MPCLEIVLIIVNHVYIRQQYKMEYLLLSRTSLTLFQPFVLLRVWCPRKHCLRKLTGKCLSGKDQKAQLISDQRWQYLRDKIVCGEVRALGRTRWVCLHVTEYKGKCSGCPYFADKGLRDDGSWVRPPPILNMVGFRRACRQHSLEMAQAMRQQHIFRKSNNSF